MNLDPNGYIRPDPDAPTTFLGKVAVLVPALILIALAAYGLWSLVHLLLN